MAGLSDQLQAILKKAQDVPEYRALVEYLLARRALPVVEQKYLGSDTRGQFATNTAWGNELPPAGVIRLAKGEADDSTNDILTHETTHAAQYQLRQHYLEILKKPTISRTPQEQQFFENYSKLYGYDSSNPSVGIGGLLTPLVSKQWMSENSKYRGSADEVPAWGMGAMARKSEDPWDNPPPHLNPSAATEFQILLDQAKKLQSEKYNRSQGR